jgi:hypothetical protein
VTTLEHPPYSPGLAPADFYQFPRMKSAMNANDLIKNATEEMKRLSQNGFQECFQQPYSSWLSGELHMRTTLKEM